MTSVLTTRSVDPGATAMELLAQGVPLSLLLDLFSGPHSEDILREEARRLPAPRLPQR